jgi:hypothetical protein
MLLQLGHLESPTGGRHEDAVGQHDHFPIFGSVKFIVKIDVVDGYPGHFKFS